ncbi:tRNA (adenosine(37)-N6)-threonylcarbamoyltransferase complex transferase subunit TsaD [Spiroplasma eriocheiris]|uniref:tRNA N6-adenosine threonylcarbamoyltransferase n=1 Tax=Spiroplasma eriocheiris TaxID=315358 RepID=A0A0H3XHR6_9MOLU|nr:tRNA (adenosine(37)-N6)-threonylcarbamoyltransferase complex transferase subunit TsaD [Spiroplasma eriocheiris]AHF57453.1 glycoprotein endopeptidase [Spiroplasma eriocheiris CCTCC M 207170]AKM53910.1 DNA-binding/iron metalloprotein/AP endonuclease [Spiroplasma eriocheiris]
MWILALETSCDETSVGIIHNNQVKTNVISSQIADHLKYGGVVPELAARLHLNNLNTVLSSAFLEANISPFDLDYIAYTEKPGLIGALHIGKIAAETLGSYLDIPVIKTNHLYGHIYAGAIDHQFKFPMLAVLVSGGHTQIVYLRKHLDFEILGTTLDDAIGECYDKVARMLGLNYPGGPVIDKLAQQGNPNTYRFPLPLDDGSYNFSFSGLKSACWNVINKAHQNHQEINLNDFCASFQKVCLEIIVKKTMKAIKEYHPQMLTLVGGVSANSALRAAFKSLARDGLEVIIPKLEYCTDNGAMIARVAYQMVLNKER